MSLVTLKEELGIRGSLSKSIRDRNSFKEKVINLLKEKEIKLKSLLSDIAVKRHRISKTRTIYNTIDEYEKDWDKKKDFNSPYQVSFRDWSIAKSEYAKAMREKKIIKKDIEILNSFIKLEEE